MFCDVSRSKVTISNEITILIYNCQVNSTMPFETKIFTICVALLYALRIYKHNPGVSILICL